VAAKSARVEPGDCDTGAAGDRQEKRAMIPRLWQWLVFFFTRPVHFSDLSMLASRMKPKAKAAPSPGATASAPIVVAAAAPSTPRERQVPRAVVASSVVSSMFHPKLEIGVSEQPLDTLPAELRDELQRPSTGGLQGSLRDH
jgi:hypothetical protein